MKGGQQRREDEEVVEVEKKTEEEDVEEVEEVEEAHELNVDEGVEVVEGGASNQKLAWKQPQGVAANGSKAGRPWDG